MVESVDGWTTDTGVIGILKAHLGAAKKENWNEENSKLSRPTV